MTGTEPTTELDARFSAEGATATPWSQARQQLQTAEVFWLSTVRPDGRPHVTSLLAVWLDDALYFCTGDSERKADNLAHDPRCALTTGSSVLGEGLDLVVHGEAVRVTDVPTLRRVAEVYECKYGSGWRFEVDDAGFVGGEGNRAGVYQVAPVTAFGFAKGAFSQTRWSFPTDPLSQ